MKRYIKDFVIDGSPEAAYNAVAAYLDSEGYRYKQYKGENVFQKGMGFFSGPTFFKISVSGYMMCVETWMKTAVFPGIYAGETSPDGAIGFLVKGPWKERIAKIEELLTAAFPTVDYAHNIQLTDSNSMGAMNFCTACGEMLPQNARFCMSCGTPVNKN